MQSTLRSPWPLPQVTHHQAAAQRLRMAAAGERESSGGEAAGAGELIPSHSSNPCCLASHGTMERVVMHIWI